MRIIAIAAATLLALGACSSNQAATDDSPGSDARSSATADTGAYPVTVNTCGTDITLEKAPEKVMIMGANGVEAMHQLGVLDRIAVSSGSIDLSVFDKEVSDHLESVTKLEGEKSETGGAVVSTEAILEQRVDLIIGYVSGVDQESLANAGVPLYTPDAYCPDSPIDKASFELVYEEVDTIAQLFGVQDQVEAVNDALKKKVPAPATVDPEATAATLYITPGVEKMWAYGPSSMVQPIMESNGLKNVYEDQAERVPEMSVEDLLQRDPKTLIIMHGEGGTDDEALETFRGFKGVDAMQAVKDNRIIVMPFALTDPPSPLSIEGAIFLKEKLAAL